MVIRFCVEKPEVATAVEKYLKSVGEKCFIMKNGNGYADGRVIDVPPAYDWLVPEIANRLKSKWN